MENQIFYITRKNRETLKTDILFEGKPEEVREQVEEMLCIHTGLFLPLQEEVSEEGEFRAYVHLEEASHMTQGELDIFASYGIDIYQESVTWKVIRHLLNINVIR